MVAANDSDRDIRSVAWSGQEFVAVIGNNVIRSTDGINWTTHEVISDPDRHLDRITYINEEFNILGSDGNLYYSLDGITWDSLNVGELWSLSGAAFSGEEFVFIATDGHIFTNP